MLLVDLEAVEHGLGHLGLHGGQNVASRVERSGGWRR